MSDTIRISEIFGPTIQGEGALIGQPTIFVRTGGCDYRCSWCDSMHAVDSEHRHEWKAMSASAIFEEIEKLSGGVPIMVSLSGGNPAIQNLKPLIDMGHAKGYKFALETQGSIAQDWFEDLDVLTLSPKPPSSDMDTDWIVLAECLAVSNSKPDIALKFIVKDDEDYIYAKDAANKYPEYPVYLQPCNHSITKDDIDGVINNTHWLINKALEDQWFEAIILPQLHVLLWGNKRGV